MKPILLVGASGHASVILDIVEQQGIYAVKGLLDANQPVGSSLLGYPVLGREEDLPRVAGELGIEGLIVAIGDNWIRSLVAARLRALVPGMPFATAVHPRAAVAPSVQVGPGSVVMAGAVLNSNARIGAHCIVNTNASLDHDGVMEDYSSLGPGAVLGGNVTVGAYSAVAIGATILHGVTVGAHAVVGAGSTVMYNVPDNVVVYGTPARVVRSRVAGDRYL